MRPRSSFVSGSLRRQAILWGAITMLPSLEIAAETGSLRSECSTASNTSSEVSNASGSQ